MKKIFTFLAALLLSVSAFATDGDVKKTTVDGIEWIYIVVSEENKTCQVGNTETDSDGFPLSAIDVNTSGDIIIPTSLDGYAVVGIGRAAFVNCAISSAVIPEAVTEIGNLAFNYCKNLVSVNIPKNVTSLGVETFGWCEKLETITIPAAVTVMDASTFDGCSGLTSITVEEGNTVFDSRDNCNAIIRTETNSLYQGCKNTTIPQSVTAIGVHAFYGCSTLTSITIHKGINSIGTNVFWGCSGLESMVVEEGNAYFDSRDNCNAIIKKADNTLLYGCKNTVIPSSVKAIGSTAFAYSEKLESINLPEGLTTINSSAFQGCSGLTSIVFPKSLRTIGATSFYGCSSLTSVEFPAGLTAIGNRAFYNCSGLTSVISHITEPFTIASGTFLNQKDEYTAYQTSATLYVPYGSKAKYEATDYWNWFKNIVELDAPESLAINEENFPDETFRELVASADIDKDQDGKLSEEEIGAVNTIRLISKPVYDLKGVEFFTNLTELEVEWTHIKSLDLSSNTALKELNVTGTEELESLNISKNTALEFLNVDNTKLSALDVSHLKGLKHLYCANLGLGTLDISQNTALIHLYCEGNQLTTLDVSNHKALTNLSCSDNNLTSLEISNNPELVFLMIDNNQITSLDISNNVKLWAIEIKNNKIGNIDVSKHTELNRFYCDNCGLSNIDVSKNTKLELFTCSNNNLGNLDLSNNTELTELDCSGTNLTELDLSANLKLELLTCNNNQLQTIDFSKNSSLRYLECTNNKITSFKYPEVASLLSMYCSNNQLTNVDFSVFPQLSSLYCDNNLIEKLDVSNNKELRQLDCHQNKLSSLIISDQSTKLNIIRCQRNMLKGAVMDSLIDNLPERWGRLYVIDTLYVDEHNVFTKEQVQRAKDKSWNVYGTSGVGYYYYEGSDPINTDLDPVDGGDKINIGDEVNADTNLDGNVVGNILYNISSGNGEFNAQEGCLVINKATSDETMSSLEGKDIFGEDVKDNFTGIVLKVAEGSGKVAIEAETTGLMVLKMKVGNQEPLEMEFEGKLKVKFPYSVTEDTYVYIYGSTKAAQQAKGMRRANGSSGSLKIFGIEIEKNSTAIDEIFVDGQAKDVYTLSGQKVRSQATSLDGLPAGIYIIGGKKVVVK